MKAEWWGIVLPGDREPREQALGDPSWWEVAVDGGERGLLAEGSAASGDKVWLVGPSPVLLLLTTEPKSILVLAVTLKLLLLFLM